MDDNAVGTVLDVMPQPPTWSTPNQLEASSPHGPRTGAGNQEDSVVQIGSAERLAKTPLSSVLGSPGTPDGHDPSHMKQGEACGTQANATSEPVVCSLEDGGQFAAPDPPSSNSFLAQLTTTPARSSQSGEWQKWHWLGMCDYRKPQSNSSLSSGSIVSSKKP